MTMIPEEFLTTTVHITCSNRTKKPFEYTDPLQEQIHHQWWKTDMHAFSQQQIKYFWFKYDLGQKYYAPQVRPN